VRHAQARTHACMHACGGRARWARCGAAGERGCMTRVCHA
jgi:hypothetical protein